MATLALLAAGRVVSGGAAQLRSAAVGTLLPPHLLNVRGAAAAAGPTASPDPSSSSTVASHSGDTDSSTNTGAGLGPRSRRLEPSQEEIRTAYTHCARLVSQHDAESLSWVMLLPRDVRARVLALRAFNLETLLVSEHVKSGEKGLAALRFQWWRDAVARLAGPPPAHPVLLALWDASRTTPLSRYNLRRIVDAREEEYMRSSAPLTIEDLESHCEGTSSQLLYLQLAAAGIRSREADHAASHVGKAVGIALALRGTPYQASQRRCLLPVEACARRKVSQEEIFRGPPASEGLRDVALDLGTIARAHLSEARSLASRLPRGAAAALLPAVLAGEYLSALERKGFDLFDPSLPSGGVSPLRRALMTKWHAWRRTF